MSPERDTQCRWRAAELLMWIQQPIDALDLLDVGDMLINEKAGYTKTVPRTWSHFCTKGGKRCLNTTVGVIAFLDPWKKAQEEAPRRSLGDLTVLNMHFGIKHNFFV